MSIEVMSLVWKNFNRGGSEKLAMLALADWCNDDGSSLHPSIKGVAKKINVSESQARRIIHGFINEGYLTVIANHGGGNPRQSRHYKLNVEMLSTPCMDATPSTNATPGMDARDPWHGCARPLAPMTPEPSLTINNPPLVSNKKKSISKSLTLEEFLTHCQENDEPAIPDDHTVFKYAEDVGIPHHFLKLGWLKFKSIQEPKKKQKDWGLTFLNYVKLGYLRVWYIDDNGQYVLTTSGKQLQREVA